MMNMKSKITISLSKPVFFILSIIIAVSIVYSAVYLRDTIRIYTTEYIVANSDDANDQLAVYQQALDKINVEYEVRPNEENGENGFSIYTDYKNFQKARGAIREVNSLWMEEWSKKENNP